MNVKRCFLSCLAIAGLGLVSCASPPVPIAFADQGKTKVLRCSVRAQENRLYVSSYIAPQFAVTSPVGSPAEVTMFSTQRMDITLNKIPYIMYPMTVPFTPTPDQFLARYLVADKEKLGLDKMEATKRQNILNGVAQVGMTKDEVYMSLGPPVWVDFDYDATNLTYEAIMDKNRWVYATTNVMGFLWKQVYLFSDGKLTGTIQ